MVNIKEILRSFIIENFITDRDGDDLSENDSLLEKGIIDSTGVLELVTFIEEKFEFAIEDEEIIPENLDTINKASRYICKKIEGARV